MQIQSLFTENSLLKSHLIANNFYIEQRKFQIAQLISNISPQGLDITLQKGIADFSSICDMLEEQMIFEQRDLKQIQKVNDELNQKIKNDHEMQLMLTQNHDIEIQKLFIEMNQQVNIKSLEIHEKDLINQSLDKKCQEYFKQVQEGLLIESQMEAKNIFTHKMFQKNLGEKVEDQKEKLNQMNLYFTTELNKQKNITAQLLYQQAQTIQDINKAFEIKFELERSRHQSQFEDLENQLKQSQYVKEQLMLKFYQLQQQSERDLIQIQFLQNSVDNQQKANHQSQYQILELKKLIPTDTQLQLKQYCFSDEEIQCNLFDEQNAIDQHQAKVLHEITINKALHLARGKYDEQLQEYRVEKQKAQNFLSESVKTWQLKIKVFQENQVQYEDVIKNLEKDICHLKNNLRDYDIAIRTVDIEKIQLQQQVAKEQNKQLAYFNSQNRQDVELQKVQVEVDQQAIQDEINIRNKNDKILFQQELKDIHNLYDQQGQEMKSIKNDLFNNQQLNKSLQIELENYGRMFTKLQSSQDQLTLMKSQQIHDNSSLNAIKDISPSSERKVHSLSFHYQKNKMKSRRSINYSLDYKQPNRKAKNLVLISQQDSNKKQDFYLPFISQNRKTKIDPKLFYTVINEQESTSFFYNH